MFAAAIHSPVEVFTAHFILHTDLNWFIAIASVLICIATFLYYYYDVPPVRTPEPDPKNSAPLPPAKATKRELGEEVEPVALSPR